MEATTADREIERLIAKAQNIMGGLGSLVKNTEQMLDRIRMSEPREGIHEKESDWPTQSFSKLGVVLEGMDQKIQELGIKILELEKYI